MKTKHNSKHNLKKLLPFLLLFVSIASGQTVNIPDANFKALLIASNSTSGVAANSSFQPIEVDTNHDGEIQYSEAATVYSLDIMGLNIISLEGISAFTNLGWLRCSNNNLTTVDLSQNLNLNKLQIGENQLTTLDVSMLTNLVWLVCNNNQLSSLNVLPLVNLELLDCRYNNLTTIDVSSLSNIYTLDLSHNQISSLDLNGADGVVQLILQNNQLSFIDLSMLYQVQVVYLSFNNLTAIDISNLHTVSQISLHNNQLSTLDASQNVNLTYLGCTNNNMQSLFIKNGSDETLVDDTNVFSGNSLIYICADESQIETIQNNLNLIGNTSTVVNSYCSFTPGGNYNTITGTITYDFNNNGCDSGDVLQDNIRVDMQQWGINNATMSNSNGVYTFFTTFADQGLSLNLENPSYFNVSPPNPTVSFNDTNLTAIQDFCISPNGNHMDLEVVITPIIPARPGFNAFYKLVYRNKGTQTLSGSIDLTFDDTRTDFLISDPITDNQFGNNLSWNFSNLVPFETRIIYITLYINSPTEVPPVNDGDFLDFTAVINPIAGDEDVDDNTFIAHFPVVNSMDPNNIMCLEGDVVGVNEIGKYLHYFINFENTGSYYAENVVVKTTIDTTKYNLNSMQLLDSSNPVYTRINGNTIEFIFKNINLAAASGNPPVGGHGDILFKIKSNSNLVNGDFVSKKADIFFDYNAPITTNDAITTYQTLKNPIQYFDNTIKIYPNPTNSIINISSNAIINEIELYDIQGRILERHLDSSKNITLDISSREVGIYFLKIKGENGSKVEKLVKE